MIPIIKNPFLILLLFLLDIIIVVYLLFQIHGISLCDCFTKKGELATELNYIFWIEVGILLTYIGHFLQLWRLTDLSFGQVQLLRSTQYAMAVFFIVMTILYCLLTYFIYAIREKADNTCDCFNNELKYTLHFQILVFSISYIVLIHQLFMQWLKEHHKSWYDILTLKVTKWGLR